MIPQDTELDFLDFQANQLRQNVLQLICGSFYRVSLCFLKQKSRMHKRQELKQFPESSLHIRPKTVQTLPSVVTLTFSTWSLVKTANIVSTPDLVMV